jgi:hypothetical protein
MHFMRSTHLDDNKPLTRKRKILNYFTEIDFRERQLPKLNVAGSIPVSRSNAR